jgi:hypothetical protein
MQWWRSSNPRQTDSYGIIDDTEGEAARTAETGIV